MKTENSRVSGSNLLSGINMNSVVSVSKTYDNLDRLTNISSTAGSKTYSYNYTYNDSDKRSKCTLADGSYWVYDYDDLGQVIKGQKFSSDDVALPGQSFGYDYDTIGNLKSENRNGSVYNYTSNSVNEYTQRTIPGYINIAGKAHPDAKVTIHCTSQGTSGYTKPQRYGEYYNAPYTFDNTSGPISETFDIYAVKYDSGNSRDIQAKQTLNIFIPQTPQTFTYDNDGNMTADGVYTYTWNAENRLIKKEKSGSFKVEYVYDYMGRRTSRLAYNWVSNDWSLVKTEKYVYDGWNKIATLDENSQLTKSMLWGEDLSGTLQGAGGVGGLLSVTDSDGTYFPIYDGNGNIMVYVNSVGGNKAEYSYDPFGRLTCIFGTKSNDFEFRFSTKYRDELTGDYDYGKRDYCPELGRWLSRDPIGEITYDKNTGEQKLNPLYDFVKNDPVNNWDYLGLETKCCNGKSYDPEKECCCEGMDKIAKIKDIENENKSLRKEIYEALKDDTKYGTGFVTYYLRAGDTGPWWQPGLQCAEQSCGLVKELSSYKYWKYKVIGGGRSPNYNPTPEYKRHHVVKVSCKCISGDCPHAGEDYIVDTLARNIGTTFKNAEEFRKQYSEPDNGKGWIIYGE